MFKDRKRVGNALEKKIENYFGSLQNCQWRRSGQEHDANAARYTTDYAVRIDGTEYWVDAKASETIERECFTFYCNMVHNGQHVRLLFDWGGSLISINPVDLVFIINPAYHNPYNIPCDGPWRQMRKAANYEQFKQDNPTASGCDCAFINFVATPKKVLMQNS